MRLRLLLAVVTATLAAAGAAAPTAGAAIAYAPCSPAGFQCGRLTVPIDRTGAVGGEISLNITRAVVSSNPGNVAVLALAGGPGQAAVPAATDFARVLGPALATRDLLVYDQRGTGGSNRLRCAAFESASSSIVSSAGSCASQLGPARGFYRTADTVQDIEDIRRESGYDKLVLFGVSYGTKVATDYAAAYPDRVESLVLDSVVPPEGSDVFNRSTFAATGRALGDLCTAGACAGVSGTPLADLRRLVRRTERRELRGTINDSRGRRLPVALTPLGLFAILLGGDLNPTMRAEMPGSVRSALRGDLQPILRLRARAAGLSGIPSTRLQGALDTTDSDALFAATRCEESVFPWDRAASPSVRASQATAAAKRLGRAAVDPFDSNVALLGEILPLCVGWPNAAPPPSPPAPLPAVPTLILDGDADLRTPLEDARSVGARIPGSQVVGIPFTGHSVLGSDLSDCSAQAVAAFFGGHAVPLCHAQELFKPTPVAPTSLAQLPGRSKADRTLVALRATLNDVRRQFLGDAVAAGRATPSGSRVAGLRSGTALWTSTGISLRRVEYVPGVIVSGFSPHSTTARASFTVAGRSAAHGQVRVAGDGHVSGRLDGQKLSGRFVRAAAAGVARAIGPVWPGRLPRSPLLARLGG
jgi:pimeloyl-ACP methyl ester carboxylesterase